MTEKRGFEFLDTGIFPGTILFVFRMGYDEVREDLVNAGYLEWVNGLEHDKPLVDSAKYLAMERIGLRDGVEKTCYYIFMKDFDFSDYDMCKLAHECLHICQFMLPPILERNREIEAEAYLHTHLMMQCLKFLR